MPHSKTRRAIALRRKYTQEKTKSAAAGVARAGGLGLDECTARQQDLRATLALLLFNTETVMIGRWPKPQMVIRPEHVSTITCYDSVVSPRRDHLVLVSHAPDNVADYFAKEGRGSVAGFRRGAMAPTERGYRCYDLVYVPTGALLTVTSDKHGPDPARVAVGQARAAALSAGGTELTHEERCDVAALPGMSPDAKRLLAGLAVRANLVDPYGRWYLGAWFGQDKRRLIGSDDHWDMEWFGGYPSADDLVACLTDPKIGIRGGSARSIGPSHHQLSLGDARLTIRAWTTRCSTSDVARAFAARAPQHAIQ